MRCLFVPFFFALSSLCQACDSATERIEMASILYQDAEFRDFTCGDRGGCTPKMMKNSMQFDSLRVPNVYKKFCTAQTIVNVKNRYIGVFSTSNKRVRLELIAFGLDVAPYHDDLIRGISVVRLTDTTTQTREREKYEWTGKAFYRRDPSDWFYGEEAELQKAD